jgi:hypothetical protein
MEDADAEKGMDDWASSGDVKYHLGMSFSREYPDGRKIQLELLPNPSHLEAVNPLVRLRFKSNFTRCRSYPPPPLVRACRMHCHRRRRRRRPMTPLFTANAHSQLNTANNTKSIIAAKNTSQQQLHDTANSTTNDNSQQHRQ